MTRFIFLLLTFVISSVFPQAFNEWRTYFESSGFLATPRYEESMSYFERLAEYSEYATFKSFGISPQGRELNYLVVSESHSFDPVSAKATGNPILLIVNGIHSGEIGGKDACMLLLRDILISEEKLDLLDNVTLLIVPIFNVDGHERMSPYNRINQNGPEEMGWRTTAQNINLNRDWLKADAPEMRFMIKLFSEWIPDFLIDTHCTDGADYQYTITYAVERFGNIYSKTGQWLKSEFIPSLERGVEEKGFLVHPYVNLKEWRKGLDEGIIYEPATPRFSIGYAAIQNRPSLLIETHMLKPYKDRVYSTKAMIEITLEFINNNPEELLQLNKEADEKSIELFVKNNNYLPISFDRTENFEEIDFKGYDYSWEHSNISGGEKLVYTNNKKTFKLKYFNDVVVSDSVDVPKGYLIPQDWYFLTERMKLHGIDIQQIGNDTLIFVKRYKFMNVKFDEIPYEGRHMVSFDVDEYKENLNVEKGTYYVSTNQVTLRVIVNLLEPKAEDSFVRWGFMNQIFERKEYYENYVMEKIASAMLENNPDLKNEFEEKLTNDKEFKNDPQARLDFFYKRSPYIDKNFNLYPISMVE